MHGISFIVRARNEAENLFKCLNSLNTLNIPFEILVFLHLCNDNSKEILHKLLPLLPIKIFEYDIEVSRAGYETFVTPEAHINSFITYSKFCFGKAAYNYKFRWDADFFATPELIEFLNNINLQSSENLAYKIPCDLGDTGIRNEEIYLSNCLIDIKKYLFWENYIYSNDCKVVDLKDICSIKSLSYKHVKEYWKIKEPWFLNNDTILTVKYNNLIKDWGSEPIGMARASNPEADYYIKLALDNIQSSIN